MPSQTIVSKNVALSTEYVSFSTESHCGFSATAGPSSIPRQKAPQTHDTMSTSRRTNRQRSDASRRSGDQSRRVGRETVGPATVYYNASQVQHTSGANQQCGSPDFHGVFRLLPHSHMVILERLLLVRPSRLGVHDRRSAPSTSILRLSRTSCSLEPRPARIRFDWRPKPDAP